MASIRQRRVRSPGCRSRCACPGGFYAVKTKWTTARSDLTNGADRTRWQPAIQQTHNAARKIRLLLRSAGVLAQVRPVLVFWGPSMADLPGGSFTVDGVLVCHGRQAATWRPLLESSASQENEAAASAALTSYFGRAKQGVSQLMSWT